jgi:hypothetical protein
MQATINPFISITPSKSLTCMSSGSWLTPHNCEISYYDRGSIITQGQGRGLTANFLILTHLRGHYLPHHVLSHNIRRGHYLPCQLYCLALACLKAIIQIRLLSFCHGTDNL